MENAGTPIVVPWRKMVASPGSSPLQEVNLMELLFFQSIEGGVGSRHEVGKLIFRGGPKLNTLHFQGSARSKHRHTLSGRFLPRRGALPNTIVTHVNIGILPNRNYSRHCL
jgi:hypothetical protein